MESKILEVARKALAEFEANIAATNAPRHLAKGLDLLDEIYNGAGEQRTIAKNIGDAYVRKTIDHIAQCLQLGNATEPELESLFQLLREVEPYDFGDKNELSPMKVQIVKALFNSYFKGFTNEEKQRQLNELRDMSR